ncbi:flagellar basal body rod C-terminal domain-containing protein [Actinokineospora auranticolor]|uniref:Flagellar basal-body rod protein FlgC n=1 Tax=Actinokineospora auranticolor TaxID=155976 RepID=A0A2S6GMM0_9PSEU|nr:flagellar basal body rod C-terminal domain-containing protein [Actinokineospora auranticolor]PPK66475.1 flagellar basal-body rod protein FlgC [Actinokineospora auranticolor]
MFNIIDTAASGASVHRKWLDAVSDNMANINNATSTSSDAFQERFVVAKELPTHNGTVVSEIKSGDTTGRIVYEPTNPLADAQGYVKYPDINLSDQMGYLIMAQRGYQANIAVVERATNAYQAALQLGKNA